jgi:hypothetical protein
MRTTIRLSDELLAEAKIYAAQTGKTLTALIEDALREMLSRRSGNIERKPVHLTTFGGRGVQPGIDLDDSAGLLSIMEQMDASA